jgi:GT2 family glycosyltransferase
VYRGFSVILVDNGSHDGSIEFVSANYPEVSIVALHDNRGFFATNNVALHDEDFLIYEDVDLSFRAQLKGYKCVYVPEAWVYHRKSSSIVHDPSLSVYYDHRNLEWGYIQKMPFRLLLRTIFLYILQG